MKPSSITASAASSRSPSWSSRSSRRATTSRSRGGTVTSPEASTDAASSSAKNGLPAAERSIDGQRAGPQRPAGGPLRDRRERGAVERTERHLHRGAALEQARAHERGRLGERLVAHAGDHEQALAGGAAREVVHERHRRLVGGVQVVDHEHDAALRGGLRQQLGDRREDAMAIHGLLRPPPPGGAPRAAVAPGRPARCR